MKPQITELDNGFRIATERMDGLGSAAIGIWISAGGRHEREDQNGIAHFLEHMAFKGTKTRSAQRIAETIEGVGGYLNAYTSREATAYYARVLEADVPLALEVLGDILRNSLYEPSEVETERTVILQEIGQTLDTPDDIVFDWLQEEAFPDQALGRSILGPAEKVSGFSREDILSFVQEHYRADRMILSAAGAVDHDSLVAQAEKIFGDLPRGGATRKQGVTFGQTRERRELKALEQVHWCYAMEGPSFKDPDFYTAQIHAIILGGGMSSRLFQEIREKRGLAYSVFASLGSFEDTGMLTLYAGTSGKDVRAAAEAAMAELSRAGEDISEAELARARAQLKAGLVMGLESSSSRAERLARMLGIWGRAISTDETITAIDQVDLTSLKGYAKRIACEASAVQALYGPAEDALTIDALNGLRAA